MKEYNTLDDFNVENKTVLLRVDFNMPLDKKTLNITDDTRIRLALPTIQELVNKKAKTVISCPSRQTRQLGFHLNAETCGDVTETTGKTGDFY